MKPMKRSTRSPNDARGSKLPSEASTGDVRGGVIVGDIVGVAVGDAVGVTSLFFFPISDLAAADTAWPPTFW